MGRAAATLPAADIGRARKFYTETLGFTPTRESEFGITFELGGGTGLFLYPSEFAGTNKATAMTINVDDFDSTVSDLREKGISFMDFDYGEFKTENGIAQTPEGPGAWFADPDGNTLSLTQFL
jgi:predicted enzyme related to lactoylglutathione lyase